MTIVLRQLIGTSNSPHQCRRFEIPASVTRVHLRNFKSKSGTRIIELLVPFGFRSSCPRVPHRITNFENRALAPSAPTLTALARKADRVREGAFQSTLPHGRRSSRNGHYAVRARALSPGRAGTDIASLNQ